MHKVKINLLKSSKEIFNFSGERTFVDMLLTAGATRSLGKARGAAATSPWSARSVDSDAKPSDQTVVRRPRR